MPTEPDIEAVAEEVFTALADPSRRGILAALAAGGPATATDLATRLPITRQAIAKHLALLSDAGLGRNDMLAGEWPGLSGLDDMSHHLGLLVCRLKPAKSRWCKSTAMKE